MLKVVIKKTVSLFCCICLLTSCAMMAFATTTDAAKITYAELIADTTERVVKDMTGEVPVTGNNTGIRVGDTVTGGAAGAIGGNISGFTDYKNGKSVEGKTLVAAANDPADAANGVLKMTGETATGTASVYSAFDTRVPESSKSFEPTEARNNYLQLWEIKVKMPASATGELRLFVYNNYSWFSAPRYQNTVQVMVKNGSVYRIEEKYDMINDDEKYTDCIATELKSGEWYTFVRVMDMRNTKEYKDKVYVFDKDGAQVSDDTDWRTAGKKDGANDRLSLGFAGKDFNTGEDVYFDDLAVRYITEPAMKAALDVTNSKAGKMMALSYDSAIAASDDYTWVSDKYQNTLRAGQYQDYNIDVFLPDVAEDNLLKLFSVTMKKDWSAVAYNNYAFIIKGGTVYTNYHNYGGTNDTNTSYGYDNVRHIKETVMTDNSGENLVLSPKTWYTFSYQYDITTAKYTATVKERSTGKVLASVTGDARYKTTVDTQNGRINIIGVKNFSEPVLFDNAVCIAKDAEGNVKNKSVNYDFNDLTIGTPVSEVTKTSKNPTNVGVPCYAVSEGDYFLTGENVITPQDVQPVKISGITGTNFTKDNVKLYGVNGGEETEVVKGCADVSFDDGEGYVSFYALEYDKTYVLKLTGQISDDKWALPIDDEFTFTIDPDLLAIVPNFIGALGTNSLSATVTVTNDRKTPVDYLIVLATYNGSALDKISIKEGEVKPGGEPAEIPVDAVDATGATRAEIMIWDGWSGLKPIHPGIALPAAE